MNRERAGARHGLVDVMYGTDVVTASVEEVVADTVERVLEDAGVDAGVLSLLVADAITGAFEGSKEIGADVAETASGVMIGALRVATEGGAVPPESAADTISLIASALVEGAIRVRCDVAAATDGLLSGAITGGTEVGLSPDRALAAATSGATQAADRLGSETEDRVLEALSRFREDV